MSVPPADGDPAAAAAAATPGVDERRRRKFSYYSQLYVIPAVDAVDAGKGQLEISVNQGRVPNNVQMQGAGRYGLFHTLSQVFWYAHNNSFDVPNIALTFVLIWRLG